MPALPIHDFLAIAADTVMFDVRSPAEYAAGHLPGARSMPLFSNDERAAVGTVYKQQGQLPALTLGLEIAGPKMAGFVRQAQAAVGEGGRVGLYCWRGGMRSGSVGWLLGQAGFQVSILKGGYKAFRSRVQAQLANPWPLRVVGGRTGSGKTDLLYALANLGEQVVDLEGLANHKGSAFGGIGQPPQPRVEMFENELATRLMALDPGRPIWLEDESQSIGHVFIYGPFFARMQAAPLIKLDTSHAVRVERLVHEYAGLPLAELSAAIGRIARRMGPQHAKAALDLLEQGDYAAVATLALAYYDKAYDHCVVRRPGPVLGTIPLGINDIPSVAEAFVKFDSAM